MGGTASTLLRTIGQYDCRRVLQRTRTRRKPGRHLLGHDWLRRTRAMKYYDAIIIGTGAAGGIVACVLAEAGRHVLLLERGPSLSFNEVGRDHLRNQRFALYGHNAGPEIDG